MDDVTEVRTDDDGVLWRALVEASPDVVLVVSLDGTILSVNRPAPAFAGRTLLGHKIWEFASGDAETRLREKIREVAEGRRAIRYEQEGLGVQGESVLYEVQAIPVETGGRVDRLIWSSRDITASVKERERLAFQASLLAQVSQPVVAATRDSVVTYWNDAATSLFGWTADEVVGRPTGDFFHPRFPRGRDEMVQSIRTTDRWRGEIAMQKKNGEEVVVEASVRVMPVTRSGITVMHDISARRALEAQLGQSQKMEAIGLLAGGVAHDFNNLLAVILGFTELASRQLPPDHRVVGQLGEVCEAARRGAELTHKLLAFSRKQIMQARLLDVSATVTEFSRLIERVVGEDVHVVIDAAPAPVVVRADAVQLEQVLLNLCTNARQAMPGGGQLRVATRAVHYDEDFATRNPWARAGDYAEITVSDTGVGMDDRTRERIFEPFFTTKSDGTGLGLATVYGIVQQHEGFVRVESTPGVGTTFRVHLPTVNEVAPVPEPRPAARRAAEARAGEVILLAEDEPALRAMLAATLGESGYEVVATANGEEAIREFERLEGRVALVLLDVVMPRLSAREVLERIHATRPGVRILLMTGYAPESTGLAGLIESGGLPLLLKPFTPEALAARVRSVIDGGA